MDAMTRNVRLYHYLVNIFIQEGLRLTCNEEDFKQEMNDFMEDVYKGHKWDFSEWQSRLATKTSHPDDNSEWLRRVETKNFHEQLALNRKLVYQVNICERQLRERLSRGLKIGDCSVTEIQSAAVCTGC
ncbi:hypothetical protein DPMN_129401 [Dreissena polymorpha]|uniref:Uncharacterized protein n=1 Tax=Dreissena polymorpha TaxID=45954 RepID=A0A9D4JY79_DREPO|nr:hypothetical protein DPMN_129401 [Dreissena polymorpha]